MEIAAAMVEGKLTKGLDVDEIHHQSQSVDVPLRQGTLIVTIGNLLQEINNQNIGFGSLELEEESASSIALRLFGAIVLLILVLLFWYSLLPLDPIKETNCLQGASRRGKSQGFRPDEIDKAHAARQRGITILRVIVLHICFVEALIFFSGANTLFWKYISLSKILWCFCSPMWSMRLLTDTIRMLIVQDTQTMLKNPNNNLLSGRVPAVLYFAEA
ncbi:hypothetical protein IFM89_002757 [Coptis chinensis]|uniref:Uncharacterized protein n=1 Tax=Coptis chinensis TaxID=261450 RepID=A0A835HTD7_9MAGN|nr:hypothetical protein IFM89_002757 [Coptis chinensis]